MNFSYRPAAFPSPIYCRGQSPRFPALSSRATARHVPYWSPKGDVETSLYIARCRVAAGDRYRAESAVAYALSRGADRFSPEVESILEGISALPSTGEPR